MAVRDLPILMKAGKDDPKIQAEAFQEIIKLTLKKAVPEATDEEIQGISAEYFQALTEAIAEVNNLSKPKQE